ncbi:MAG: glycosyltransferase [Anaerolineales bacterium]|nr:glycosyltransferase [Anaerolineales bacterium]
MLDDVTVIVPTRDEARNIRPFLASLPPQVPLIVVDASEDDTPDIVMRARPEQTRILRRPTTVTQARQMGAAMARTTWLLFTDADISFAPDYFQKLMPYLAGDADLIYGPKQSAGAFVSYYRWFSRGQAVVDRLGIPAATGSNLLIRHAVFDAVDGFDLRLVVNEDSEIAWRIKRRGFVTRFAPQLVVLARDHRRLAQGRARKTLHSLLRCGLLYTGLMPARWRSSDWGYWSKRRATRLL